MGNDYQAVYDAVRSRLSNCDVGGAVESVMRDMNISHYFMMAGDAIQRAAASHEEPSAVYRPKLGVDGNQWYALYGENLQDGVAGFGDSPALALADFNKNWYAKLPAKLVATA